MKRKKNLILSLIAVAILFACHKELSRSTVSQPTTSGKSLLTIAEAKAYLDSSLHSNSTTIKLTSKDSTKPGPQGSAFWAKAKELKWGKFSVVELPFNMNKKVIPIYHFPNDYVRLKPDASVANAAFSRLIIYKNLSNNSIDKEIITYIPDKDYLIAHHGDASHNWIFNFDNDFSGYLEYKKWDGTVLYVYRMLGGRRIAQYFVNQSGGKLQVLSTKSKLVTYDVTCYNTTTDYYSQGCATDGEGGITSCSDPVYNYSSTSTNCSYSGGGGSNTTSDPAPGSTGGGVGGSGGGYVISGLNDQNTQNYVDSMWVNDTVMVRCDSMKLLQIQAYQKYGRMYRDVANYNIPYFIKDRINTLAQNGEGAVWTNYNIQGIYSALGPVVNSDFYPIRISQLPSGMSMADLTEYFRTHINNFISPNLGVGFYPYKDQYIDDTNYFNSPTTQSLGSIVHIQMVNDGSVVESDYQINSDHAYFKFSTISSPGDYSHPVSGNREFGVYKDPQNPGQYTFYTMGVDRTDDWLSTIANWRYYYVFNGGDQLWSNMQQNMVNFINSNGGQASYYNSTKYIARPDFDDIKGYLTGAMTWEDLKRQIGC